MAEPVEGKAMSFKEMIADVQQKANANERYVRETGLCYNCKKNKADPDGQCQSCKDEFEKLLKQLRGPGFMEVQVPAKSEGE